MKGIIAKVKWQTNNVILGKRVFLFCFGEKCMSGKISKFKQLILPQEFEIWVEFIDPSYFQNEFIIGKIFTINEASKILGKGEITEIE